MPTIEGQVYGPDLDPLFGADGPGAVVWEGSKDIGNGKIEVEGDFGTLTVDSDGHYVFELNRETYDNLRTDKVAEFKYTVTDADGDSSESVLKIDLKGIIYDGGDIGRTIEGGDGHDTLFGTGGDDIFIGGAGDDTFKWQDGDAGTALNPAHDTVKDFGLGNGDPNGEDTLDLADLLTATATDDLTQFLSITYDGANTVINVSSGGGLVANGPDQVITLEGVNLVGAAVDQTALINSLISDGKLVVVD